MSESILNKMISDQKQMSDSAMRVVLTMAFCIHILLNAFAYINHDQVMKIEMPVLSGITLLAILIGMKVFNHQS